MTKKKIQEKAAEQIAKSNERARASVERSKAISAQANEKARAVAKKAKAERKAKAEEIRAEREAAAEERKEKAVQTMEKVEAKAEQVRADMAKMREFLEAMHADSSVRDLVREMGIPRTHEEIVSGYARIAEAIHYRLTPEEISAGIREMEEYQRTLTAQADEAVMKVPLGEETLTVVAGGKTGCQETHVSGEWCWYTDACDSVVYTYSEQSASQGSRKTANSQAIY